MPQARSESFDSITTATSTGTERPLIPHSNSMDSLILKKKSQSKSSQPKRKENGRRYNHLVESSSVKTLFSTCDKGDEFSHTFLDVAPPPSGQRSESREGGAKVLSQSGNNVDGLDCVAPTNQVLATTAGGDRVQDSARHARKMEDSNLQTHWVSSDGQMDRQTDHKSRLNSQAVSLSGR